MKRRDFLTGTTLATVSLTTFIIDSCTNVKNKNEEQNSANDINVEFELDEETITSLQEKLAVGKYTSEQLVELYLERIPATARILSCGLLSLNIKHSKNYYILD